MVLDTSRLDTEGIVRALVPVVPQCDGLSIVSPAHLNFLFAGDTGLDYRIEASSNLCGAAGWTPVLRTNFGSAPFLWIVLSSNAVSMRFYRVLLEP